MKKIPDATQIKAWDAETILCQNISSIDLMERAARAFVDALLKHIHPESKAILVICGTGNNGGDGLAIARLLSADDFSIKVLVIGDAEKGSADFRQNLERLPHSVPCQVVASNDGLKSNSDFSADVIIDALFGSGLSRPAEGLYAEVIEWINHQEKMVIAVDIPSGMPVHGSVGGPVVSADFTITFQSPKLSFMMPGNIQHVGRLLMADIGLDKAFQESLKSPYSLIGSEDVPSFLFQRPWAAHKGNFGHALVMSGSQGMIGAAVLCVRAALRAGSGRVTAHIPACGYDIIQTAVPEALVKPDAAEAEITSLIGLAPFNAIATGPGLGTGPGASRVLRALLESVTCPLVLDADALNILAMNSSWMALLPKRTILTPHPGEFKRLAGEWKDDQHRLRLLKQFAKGYGCIVVLKGAHTSVAFPDGNVAFNGTGNPFMATAGSGDVLTGILVALLAQGCTPEQAAVAGVYLHGLAGDMAALSSDGSCAPIIASDLVERIPSAFRSLSLLKLGR